MLKKPVPKRPCGEMSTVPKCPRAETSTAPKCPHAKMSAVPKRPCAETSKVPKRPRAEMSPMPKCPCAEIALCRNVHVSKCPRCRNVHVPKRPRSRNVCAVMSIAEMLGAEMSPRLSVMYAGTNLLKIPIKSLLCCNNTLRLSSLPTKYIFLLGFRSMLWSNVESLLDVTYNKICEAMQLQKILVKKRDIVLGMNFIELLPDDKQNIVENTWKEVLATLMTHLQQSSADSSTVKQSFEGEFPKLIRLFNDLWSRY